MICELCKYYQGNTCEQINWGMKRQYAEKRLSGEEDWCFDYTRFNWQKYVRKYAKTEADYDAL